MKNSQRLREELTILQARQALEVKERALAASRNLSALETLHEKLRGITATTEEGRSGRGNRLRATGNAPSSATRSRPKRRRAAAN